MEGASDNEVGHRMVFGGWNFFRQTYSSGYLKSPKGGEEGGEFTSGMACGASFPRYSHDCAFQVPNHAVTSATAYKYSIYVLYSLEIDTHSP